MVLEKIEYVNGETIIEADNLNSIQDEIIQQGEKITTNNELLGYKENRGQLSIDGVTYNLRVSTEDTGIQGCITFVIDEEE